MTISFSGVNLIFPQKQGNHSPLYLETIIIQGKRVLAKIHGQELRPFVLEKKSLIQHIMPTNTGAIIQTYSGEIYTLQRSNI